MRDKLLLAEHSLQFPVARRKQHPKPEVALKKNTQVCLLSLYRIFINKVRWLRSSSDFFVICFG